MNNIFSKKFLKLITMGSLIDNSNNNKFIVHTSNGIYVGKLRNTEYDNSEVTENDDTLTCFNKVYKKALKNYEASEKSKIFPEISENYATIELEDVQYINGTAHINMPFVELFVDQIVGFSLGTLDK